jgi:hypothetical protein
MLIVLGKAVLGYGDLRGQPNRRSRHIDGSRSGTFVQTVPFVRNWYASDRSAMLMALS